MTMYERIRDLRIKAGMTQDDLAHAMGYKDRSMIAKIESGKVDISQTKIVEFAKVLNTTPGYLMGWVEKQFEEAFGTKQTESVQPQTPEARILARGIDKLDPEQRAQALAVVKAMFAQHPEIFND